MMFCPLISASIPVYRIVQGSIRHVASQLRAGAFCGTVVSTLSRAYKSQTMIWENGSINRVGPVNSAVPHHGRLEKEDDGTFLRLAHLPDSASLVSFAVRHTRRPHPWTLISDSRRG
jgi:hypothetical protein